MDGRTGAVEWMRSISAVSFSINRIEDLNGDNIADVAVAASSDGIYALSGANGATIWRNPSMGTNYWLEATRDLNGSTYDDVLVTSVSGTFYAFEGSNGSAIWSVNFGSNVLSLAAVPDVTGDRIPDACCGIMNGSFHAVSGADGSVLFSYTHGGGSSYAFDAVGWMPDIDNSGAAEFLGGTRDGRLYCFSGGDMTRILNLTITPDTIPTIIPPSGGQFGFTANVVNPGNLPLQFDAWIMVTLPNLRLYGPVLLRTGNTIPAGGTIARHLYQNVPANAPSGLYVYTGYIGIYSTGEVWDEDGFHFSKLGVDNSIPGDWNLTGWEENSDDENIPPVPETFALFKPAPNPFNPSTVLSFELRAASFVTLAVYDITGREVAVLVEGFYSTGGHQVEWDASAMPSGIYFARLTAGNLMQTRKLLLLK